MLLLAGCVSSMLAHKIVAPPNKSGIKPLFADWDILKHAPEASRRPGRVTIGPPAARIAVASIEPGDYGFVYDLQARAMPKARHPHIDHFNASWRPASEAARCPGRRAAPSLLLHGYLQNRNYVTPWAVRLAQAGYRCVVLDLRGHGASTGEHISFGAFEARDLSQVLDDLGRRGWDVAHVGILGVSYGASVALLTAGRDARVAAVVAFEPFASAERAVPELMRAAFAERGQRHLGPAVRRRARQGSEDRRLRLGGRRYSRGAGAHARAGVVHPRRDRTAGLSPDHSRELHEVRAARAASSGSCRSTTMCHFHCRSSHSQRR